MRARRPVRISSRAHMCVLHYLTSPNQVLTHAARAAATQLLRSHSVVDGRCASRISAPEMREH